MKAYALILFLGLSAGYAIGSFLSNEKQKIIELQLSESKKQTADLQYQIQAFKNHIGEISNLGSDKSAEEVLSKIMQIFLADLSLRIKTPEIKPSLAAEVVQANSSASAKAPEHSKIKSEEAVIKAHKLASPMAHELEKRILNSRSEQEATDLLNQTRVENFFEVLSQVKPLNQKTAQLLEGSFSGQTTPFDPTRKVVSVQMTVNLSSGTSTTFPQGKVEIFESKEGKVFSRSRGEGSLKNFSLYEGSAMIVVEHAGGENYFQLYYSQQGDFFVGNDYEKISASKYTPIGTVVLQKNR